MSDLVLVTGITGFIAKHVATELLRDGYSVRGTLRSAQREDEVVAAIANAGVPTDRLSFAVADLQNDSGWTEAAAGCRFVQHIASHFPIKQPRDRYSLLPSARDGTLRVLDASRQAERWVMTSSIVAMMYRPGLPKKYVVHPSDWSDPEWQLGTPYIIAKTLAERAAWDFASVNGGKTRLVTINPGLVLGPPLDQHFGTSLDVVSMLLRGTYPAVPPVAFAIVDVRDVARLHVNAMTTPVGGHRLLAASDTLTMQDMAKRLRTLLPKRAFRIPTTVLPEGIAKFAAGFDRALATLRPDIGQFPVADADATQELTGVEFRPSIYALDDAALTLDDFV